MEPKHEPTDPTQVRAGDPPYTAFHLSEMDKASNVNKIDEPPSRKHRDASWWGRLLVSALVWGLYILACFIPAIYIDNGIPPREGGWLRMGSPPGFVVLFMGWIPPYCIPWSANILLVVGWAFLLCERFKIAAWVGGASALIGLTTWGYDFPRLLLGYSFWQASLIMLATGATMLALLIPRQTKDEKIASVSKKIRRLAAGGVLLAATVVLILTFLVTKEAAAEKAIKALGGRVTPEGRAMIAVSFSGTKVTDKGLNDLAGLKNLQRLDLFDTGVTDAGLKELAGLKSLRSLGLCHTKVTDAGLGELAGLQNLEYLNLARTAVTDEGLKELAGLNNLQSLLLGETKVTDAGVAELRRALPKCTIQR
jgi:Leucine rich repeat